MEMQTDLPIISQVAEPAVQVLPAPCPAEPSRHRRALLGDTGLLPRVPRRGHRERLPPELGCVDVPLATAVTGPAVPRLCQGAGDTGDPRLRVCGEPLNS